MSACVAERFHSLLAVFAQPGKDYGHGPRPQLAGHRAEEPRHGVVHPRLTLGVPELSPIEEQAAVGSRYVDRARLGQQREKATSLILLSDVPFSGSVFWFGVMFRFLVRPFFWFPGLSRDRC